MSAIQNVMPFVDTETTGLDKELDRPIPPRLLELGIVVCRLPDFEVIAEQSWVACFKRSNYKGEIHPKVIEMHTKNGLWDECERVCPSKGNLFQIGKEASEFLLKHGCQNAPMAGCKPGFDRAFLRKELPNVESIFHYRDFDVNAFWILQEALTGRDMSAEKPGTAHRALADCHEAIGNIEKHFKFFEEFFGLAGD